MPPPLCCSSVPPQVTLSLRAASKHSGLLCRPTFLLSVFIFLLGMRAEGWSACLLSLAVSLFLKLSDLKSEKGARTWSGSHITCKVHGLNFHTSEAQLGFCAAMSRRNGTLLESERHQRPGGAVPASAQHGFLDFFIALEIQSAPHASIQ